jgi:hypothetical protein
MKRSFLHKYLVTTVIFFFLPLILIFSQKKSENDFLGKADLYKAKKYALEYLGESMIVTKFGIISDSIWSFSELGMQEFRSSAILIRALEDEGFKVEKGVAGMPTCFVATWGSGKPVIGSLENLMHFPCFRKSLFLLFRIR